MNSRMSRADDLRDAIGQFVDERYLNQIPQHGNTGWTPHRLAVKSSGRLRGVIRRSKLRQTKVSAVTQVNPIRPRYAFRERPSCQRW